MLRFIAILIVVLLLVSAYWTFSGPWAFAKIPGDVFFNYQGLRVHVPFGTSLIITTIITFAILVAESRKD